MASIFKTVSVREFQFKEKILRIDKATKYYYTGRSLECGVSLELESVDTTKNGESIDNGQIVGGR